MRSRAYISLIGDGKSGSREVPSVSASFSFPLTSRLAVFSLADGNSALPTSGSLRALRPARSLSIRSGAIAAALVRPQVCRLQAAAELLAAERIGWDLPNLRNPAYVK